MKSIKRDANQGKRAHQDFGKRSGRAFWLIVVGVYPLRYTNPPSTQQSTCICFMARERCIGQNQNTTPAGPTPPQPPPTTNPLEFYPPFPHLPSRRIMHRIKRLLLNIMIIVILYYILLQKPRETHTSIGACKIIWDQKQTVLVWFMIESTPLYKLYKIEKLFNILQKNNFIFN